MILETRRGLLKWRRNSRDDCLIFRNSKVRYDVVLFVVLCSLHTIEGRVLVLPCRIRRLFAVSNVSQLIPSLMNGTDIDDRKDCSSFPIVIPSTSNA